MRTGIVKPGAYSAVYPTNVLSNGVWDTCPGNDLNELGTGYFSFYGYQNGLHPAALAFTDVANGSTGLYSTYGSTVGGQQYYNGSTTYANGASTNFAYSVGHVIELFTSSTAGGRVAITSRPIAPITPGGLPHWFEACVGTTYGSTSTMGMFVGLVTLSALSTAATTGAAGSGSILSTASATQASNNLCPSTGAIGFWMHGDLPGNFDAVYQNQYANGTYSTASGVVVVQTNVLTYSTGATVNGTIYTAPIGPATPPGVLSSTQLTKLGLKFLPQGPGGPQMQWFVNGYQVAAATVTASNSTFTNKSTGFDVINPYGAIIVVANSSTTGSTSTVGTLVDFMGHAAQQLY